MGTLTFTVPGLPAPKKRPRVAFKDRRGRPLKKPHTYTPGRTRDYESAVAWAAREAMTQTGMREIVGWVSLWVVAFVESEHQGDGDNFLKSVADALQGVAYANDRQVVDWSVSVRPTGPDTTPAPCLSVTVQKSTWTGTFPAAAKKKKRTRRAKAVFRG